MAVTCKASPISPAHDGGMMKFTRFAIPGPVLIEPSRITDERGFFLETFRLDLFVVEIGPVSFVQDNHSRTLAKGTVRGLHHQLAPRAQGKLVRVGRGAILDVAVDIRPASPTFGEHVAVELSEHNNQQLWVPPGFLHGFCTLTDEVDMLYRVTDHYTPEHDRSVRWNDPDLDIAWPVSAQTAILSAKDRDAPMFADVRHELRGGD